jgi:hypothetical protein
MPHVPFVGSSSYKDQYQPFMIQPLDPNPESTPNDSRTKMPNYLMKSPVKFEGVSSYKSSYIPPPQPKADLRPAAYEEYSREQVPFYGTSSYKSQFQGYKI